MEVQEVEGAGKAPAKISLKALNVVDRLVEFLKTFEEAPGKYKYREKIASMSVEKKISVTIDFSDLLSFDTELANLLIENSEEVLAAASEAVKEVLKSEDPQYAEQVKRVFARIRGLPEDMHIPLRKIRAVHLNKLVSLEGIVTRISPVKQKLLTAVFRCKICGEEIPIPQTGNKIEKPLECPRCAAEGRKRGDFELLLEKSEFMDWQKFVLQEKPEELPAGQLPRSIEVILTDDLVDSVRPGDRATVIGILKVVEDKYMRGRAPLFRAILEANNVEVSSKESVEIEISPEDIKKIMELSRRPDIHELITNSIAPSIYGYKEIKRAIAALLFGGVPKVYPDGVRVRGDIHILLIGDPGTAKSQILRYVANIAPRAIYTTGKGSTAAGLTAAVVREKASGDFYLEAGALVLADGGVACLHPNTRVLADGKYVRIEELFESAKSYRAWSSGEIVDIEEKETEVVALNLKSLKTERVKSTVVRRKPWKGELIRIKLRSGNELILTPDHLLIDGKTLRWKKAEEFKPGDTVVAPLKLPSIKRKTYILDILPDEWLVKLSREEKQELKKEVLKRFKTLSEFNKAYNISRDFLSGRGSINVGKFRHILKDLGIYEKWRTKPLTYGPCSKREKLKTAHITPELAYFLGFAYGDGWIQKKDRKVRISITQSKVNRRQIEALRKAFTAFYDGELKEHERKTEKKLKSSISSSSNIVLYVNSPLLGYLYEYIVSDGLKNAFSLDDEALKAFVAGVIDAGGCISIKKSSKGKVAHVEILLPNDVKRDTAFAMLLRRFDIYARVVPGSSVNKIEITGKSDVRNLVKAIEKYSVKTKEIPLLKHLVPSTSDKIPLEPVKAISQKIMETVPATILQRKGLWSTIYTYAKGTHTPSRYQLEKALKRLNEHLAPEIKSNIEILLRRDYFLDEITSIERLPYNGYVYDLYVPNLHNFVAEGVITHNCIDEFDKMDPRDRVSIHEAMEQQTISIAKAGIVATLNARASVLAAANPAFGRYLVTRTLAENIDLPVTILSRFDLIFRIVDIPNREKDRQLAEYVLDFHRNAVHEIFENIIPPDLLKKYIAFARREIRPRLSDEAKKKIVDFYVKMRSRSEDPESPISITPRQLEALIRLAEANARMALREIVTEEDAQAAIDLMNYFLQSVGIDMETKRIDIDVIMTGQSKSQREKILTILDIVDTMVKEAGGKAVPKETVIQKAVEMGIDEHFARRVIDRLIDNGELMQPSPGHIKRA